MVLFQALICSLCLLVLPVASRLVSSSFGFQQLLCSNMCESLISLNSTVNFELNIFCIIDGNFCRNASTIVIQSSNDISANITCSKLLGAGLAVFNSSIVLHGVTFKNCGAYLSRLPPNVLNMINSSTTVHYHQSYVAALILINCVLNFSHVNFVSTIGFEIIAVNPNTKLFANVSQLNHFSFNKTDADINHNLGSGILFHFFDANNNEGNFDRNVVINHFSSNDNHQLFLECPLEHAKYFVPASALTLIFSQSRFEVNVVVANSYFHRVEGTFSGVIAIYQYNLQSSTVLWKSNFVNNAVYLNCNYKSGTSVRFSLNHHHSNNATIKPLPLLNISSCTFDNHKLRIINNASLVNMRVNCSCTVPLAIELLLIRNTQFLNTHGTRESACLWLKSYSDNIQSSVVVENVKVADNSLAIKNPYCFNGILVFLSINHVWFTGSTSFFSNNYGSVIKAVDSTVMLTGHMVFANNHAANGGAIQIIGKSQLSFKAYSNVTFILNSAILFGGAIYANTKSATSLCPFCFEDYNIERTRPVSTFIGNKARLSGMHIYSETLFNCYLCETGDINLNPIVAMKILRHLLQLPSDSSSGLLSLSTKPNSLKLDHSHEGDIFIFPGQVIEIRLRAMDQLNRAVYSPVHLQANCGHITTLMLCKLWLTFDEKEQLLQENKNFTSVYATVHSSASTVDSAIEAVIGCSVSEVNEAITVQFFLNNCPLGFYLNLSSGSCECSPIIDKLNDAKFTIFSITRFCSIIDQKFSSAHLESWAGLVLNDSNQEIFGVSRNCPAGNCNILNGGFYNYFSNETGLFRTSTLLSTTNIVPICNEHREGTLCGKCADGYSTSLNSRKCEKCTDRYMAFNILALLVYGLLLIAFLFAFELTMSSGLLNGIIFYANLSNIGLIDVITMYTSGNKALVACANISVKFLEMLNANPMFPSCLFDGMNELWRTAVRLIFQIYLWSIVLLLILISHYSIWLTRKLGNSSIKVLVTVFHISVSRMLLTLIDVFTAAYVYTETTHPIKVWFLDGSVRYLQHHHLILSILTLLFLCPLLLFYGTVLLFPRQVYKTSFGNKYCRPLIEAIHAPYKEGKEYWFTLRIAVLILFYSVYTIYRGLDYFLIFFITVPVLSGFIMAQIYFKPFRSRVINVLDLLTMMNFLLLDIAVWNDLIHQAIFATVIKCVVSVFFNLFLLLLIVFHRVLKFFSRYRFVDRLTQNVIAAKKFLYLKWTQKRNQVERSSGPGAIDSFYQQCDNFREPLLK